MKGYEWTHRVLRSSAADGSARMVLFAIADHADEHGECWPNVATLAGEARVSKSTVTRSVRELVKLGELVVTPRGGDTGRRGNQYRVVLDAEDRAKGWAEAILGTHAAEERDRRAAVYPAERQVQDDDRGVRDAPHAATPAGPRGVRDDTHAEPTVGCEMRPAWGARCAPRGVRDDPCNRPLEPTTRTKSDEHSNNGHRARADDADDGGWRDGGEGWPPVRVPGRPALCTTRGHVGCGWQSTADCHDCRGPS